MTDSEIIIAVARLDGFEDVLDSRTAYIQGNQELFSRLTNMGCNPIWSEEREGLINSDCPPYLTSRDAIVPVIERQQPNIIAQTIRELWVIHNVDGEENDVIVDSTLLFSTAKQLSIALLKAVGEWRE